MNYDEDTEVERMVPLPDHAKQDETILLRKEKR